MTNQDAIINQVTINFVQGHIYPAEHFISKIKVGQRRRYVTSLFLAIDLW